MYEGILGGGCYWPWALLSIYNPPFPSASPSRLVRQMAGLGQLTLAGCLPLPVLGVCLVQVGEAGPKLQDAVQRRQVELTCWRKDFHLTPGTEPTHPAGSRQSVTKGPGLQ